MNPTLYQWAIRWHVSPFAVDELQRIWGTIPDNPQPHLASQVPGSESYIQSAVRLEAARKGLKLWRNNVGVLEDRTGRPIRYGLGNDSPALNKVLKSGDLIGWRPVLITPALVGSRLAQFVSRECKRPNWCYTGTDHEKAQLRWIEALTADGGDAKFVVGEGSL